MGLVPYTAGKRRTLTPISQSVSDGSTLSLDLTTGVLDPRLTFTRAGNATYINSQGYVTWTKSNLFLQGINLSNASWTASNLTSRSSGITNPFGVAQATELFENTTNGPHGVRQTTTSNVANQYYTFSVYMKAGVGRNIGCVYDTAIGGSNVVFYTLTDAGTVTIPAGSNSTMSGTISKITDDGWYRCTYTIYTTVGGAIHAGAANGTSSGNNSYAGTAGNSIVMWGGQFEMGTVANPFIPTTTIAKYDDPRFEYDPITSTPRGLLIEGAATNLITQSETFTTGVGNWTDTNITRDGTLRASPNGTERALRVTAAAPNATIIRTSAIGSSAARTFSVWLRRYGSGTGGIQYTQNNGTNWTTQAITSSWVRYTFTHTANHQVGIRIVAIGDAIEIWGAQLEVGSGASSYIPSGASTGNRIADSCVMTGTNFTSWYNNATEGVLYAEFEKPRSQSGNTAHDFSAVGSQYAAGSGFSLYAAQTVFYPTTLLYPSVAAITPGGIASAIPAVSKQAGKWFAGNDATNFANGTQGTTAFGSGTMAMNMLSIGANSLNGTVAGRDWLNACVRRVKFWPTALSDSQIISITT